MAKFQTKNWPCVGNWQIGIMSKGKKQSMDPEAENLRSFWGLWRLSSRWWRCRWQRRSCPHDHPSSCVWSSEPTTMEAGWSWTWKGDEARFRWTWHWYAWPRSGTTENTKKKPLKIARKHRHLSCQCWIVCSACSILNRRVQSARLHLSHHQRTPQWITIIWPLFCAWKSMFFSEFASKTVHLTEKVLYLTNK